MENPVLPYLNGLRTHLEASRELLGAMIDGTERIEQILIEATRSTLNEQMNYARALAAARDVPAVTSLQSGYLEQAPDHFLRLQEELLTAMGEVRKEIEKSMGHYLKDLGASGAVMPTRAQAGEAGVTEWIQFWNKSLKSLTDASAQYARTLQPAAGPATPAARPAKKKAAVPRRRRAKG